MDNHTIGLIAITLYAISTTVSLRLQIISMKDEIERLRSEILLIQGDIITLDKESKCK